MMRNTDIFYLLVIALFFNACKSPIQKVGDTITKESLLKPIQKLSSDAFMGRGTGTEGQKKSVNYLISELKSYGIKGGMPDGSYVQQVPLTGQKTDNNARIEITKDGKPLYNFDYYTDFMAWPANFEKEVSIKNAPMLYVGYGIQAPEEQWDDFKGVDVKGKILIVKNNDPAYKKDLFAGETRLYYGRYDYKYGKARELGALGVLIIHTTPTAGYNWDVVANSWNAEQFYLKDGDNTSKESPTKINGWLTKESSQKLFKAANLNLTNQLDSADSRSFRPVFLKGVRMSLKMKASYEQKMSKNVLGVLEGTNKRLKDQYMVFSAHYDHLGITKPVKGDSINNGALDNAAGVSAVLNLAQAYKKLEPQLKRSILFLFVGAEEVGLLGSQYWVNHPTVPLEKITADINLDGMNVYGKTKDMVLIGYGRNSISDVIEKVARERGRTIKPDAHPDRGYFYRSDHFSFAKKGVPAIFPEAGTEFINKNGAMLDSLKDANYHTVNDEINKYWDLSGMVQDVRLIFDAGYRIINAEKMQKWKDGDEFKKVREESYMEDEKVNSVD